MREEQESRAYLNPTLPHNTQQKTWNLMEEDNVNITTHEYPSYRNGSDYIFSIDELVIKHCTLSAIFLIRSIIGFYYFMYYHDNELLLLHNNCQCIAHY